MNIPWFFRWCRISSIQYLLLIFDCQYIRERERERDAFEHPLHARESKAKTLLILVVLERGRGQEWPKLQSCRTLQDSSRSRPGQEIEGMTAFWGRTYKERALCQRSNMPKVISFLVFLYCIFPCTWAAACAESWLRSRQVFEIPITSAAVSRDPGHLPARMLCVWVAKLLQRTDHGRPKPPRMSRKG